MSHSNQNTGVWLVVFGIAGLAMLLQALSGGPSSGVSYESPSPRGNSVARRYVEQRFQQEGFNRADAATAADAVLKFHRAQEARCNR